LDLDTPQSDGLLKVLYLRPLDLSVDETLQELLDAVKAVGAKRIVIDSLAGFEMALAPAFRQDFRESLYRMIGALTGTGATVMSTVELTESFTDLLFSPYAISFLTDDIIRLRYVEIDGALHKILAVVKMRGGHHSKELREYTITDAGLEIGECPRGLRGLITGVPMRVDSPSSK
jgi:circadian clock protein KaiC